MLHELIPAIGLEMSLILNGYTINDINNIVNGSTISHERLTNLA